VGIVLWHETDCSGMAIDDQVGLAFGLLEQPLQELEKYGAVEPGAVLRAPQAASRHAAFASAKLLSVMATIVGKTRLDHAS
jgi:hypothetical protein